MYSDSLCYLESVNLLISECRLEGFFDLNSDIILIKVFVEKYLFGTTLIWLRKYLKDSKS